jgi:hypothetical protein
MTDPKAAGASPLPTIATLAPLDGYQPLGAISEIEQQTCRRIQRNRNPLGWVVAGRTSEGHMVLRAVLPPLNEDSATTREIFATTTPEGLFHNDRPVPLSAYDEHRALLTQLESSTPPPPAAPPSPPTSEPERDDDPPAEPPTTPASANAANSGQATVVCIHQLGGIDSLPPDAVYIGRPGQGITAEQAPWGNPFRADENTTREQAVEQYRERLWQQLRDGTLTLEQLAALHGKTLACWCPQPGPCHGHVLAAAAAYAHKQLNATEETAAA